MTNFSGQWLEAIEIAGKQTGTRGVIISQDTTGKFWVKWESGDTGIIRERGDKYRFINPPQNKFCILKNKILTLLNNLKLLYYDTRRII
jgi:hypothetical protein